MRVATLVAVGVTAQFLTHEEVVTKNTRTAQIDLTLTLTLTLTYYNFTNPDPNWRSPRKFCPEW